MHATRLRLGLGVVLVVSASLSIGAPAAFARAQACSAAPLVEIVGDDFDPLFYSAPIQAQQAPCADEYHAVARINGTAFGDLHARIGPAEAITDTAPMNAPPDFGWENQFVQTVDLATANVDSVEITFGSDRIVARGLRSVAGCKSDPTGHHIWATSSVEHLVVNGTEYAIGGEQVDIPLALGVLHVNSLHHPTAGWGGNWDARALWLEVQLFPEAGIIVSQSTMYGSDGNRC